MTGAEFLAYTKKIFLRTDKDTEIYEATTDIVVDMSLRLLADVNMKVSSALSGISSVGDYELTLPDDFGHLLGDVLIRDTGSDDTYFPLKKITKEEYDRIYHENLSSTASNRNTGTPIHYGHFAGTIYVGPAVDATDYEFKINYTDDQVAAIVAGTDPVPFTDKYRRILRDGVLSLMYKHMENFGEATQFEGDYERGLAKIQANDDFNAQDDSPVQYSGV
ncbi:MAG: hypothetical protein DRJ03_03540 [Chloroflexi bacterium]|nr:MAG: hypothetical protein DRJ03_03540 [Chloroflexota bacterium]